MRKLETIAFETVTAAVIELDLARVGKELQTKARPAAIDTDLPLVIVGIETALGRIHIALLETAVTETQGGGIGKPVPVTQVETVLVGIELVAALVPEELAQQGRAELTASWPNALPLQARLPLGQGLGIQFILDSDARIGHLGKRQLGNPAEAAAEAIVQLAATGPLGVVSLVDMVVEVSPLQIVAQLQSAGDTIIGQAQQQSGTGLVVPFLVGFEVQLVGQIDTRSRSGGTDRKQGQDRQNPCRSMATGNSPRHIAACH